MKKAIRITLGFLSILIGLFIFLYPIVFLDYFDEDNFKERKVKCYDKYNNEIIGQNCIQKYNDGSNFLVLSIFTSSFFFVIGIGFFIFDEVLI